MSRSINESGQTQLLEDDWVAFEGQHYKVGRIDVEKDEVELKPKIPSQYKLDESKRGPSKFVKLEDAKKARDAFLHPSSEGKVTKA